MKISSRLALHWFTIRFKMNVFVYIIMFFAQLLPLSGNVQVRRLPPYAVLLAELPASAAPAAPSERVSPTIV